MTREDIAMLPYPQLLDSILAHNLQDVLLYHMDLIHYEHHVGHQHRQWSQSWWTLSTIEQALENVMYIAVHYCNVLPDPSRLFQDRIRVFDNYTQIYSIDICSVPLVIVMLAFGHWRVGVNMGRLTNLAPYLQKYSYLLEQMNQNLRSNTQ